MSNEKKILLLIVEGQSDQTTLENGLRKYINEHYPNSNVRFDAIHGDITVFKKTNSPQKSIIPSAEIKKTIGNEVKDYLKKEKLKARDILGIAQVCDLDTAFGQNHLEIQKGCQFYHDTSKHKTYVESQSKLDHIEQVYKAKVANIKMLYSLPKFSISKIEIPYHLFYFGIDLEYALYHTTNNTDAYKTEQSFKFDQQYGDDASLFKKQFDAIPAIDITYVGSWSEAKLVNHAYDQISNFKFIFDWIDELMLNR